MKLAEQGAAGTGSRIRQRRMDRGVRQADLAATVGISPSYLNLIEHNRRRIAGTLLADIARALEVEPAFLIEGADRAVLDQLQTAGAMFAEAGPEIQRAEEMAARYPGWAGLVAAQSARVTALEAQVQMLSDRMAYDPALATSLHAVISAVTSIRSTAAILTSDETIDADWQQRFHRNIHDDAVRLAASSDALMAYLDAPEEATGPLQTPLEEMEGWLTDRSWHVPSLEYGDPIDQVLALAGDLRPSARALLRSYLETYQSDAAALPMAQLDRAIGAVGLDPFALARDTGLDPTLIMRRLVALPKSLNHQSVGLAVSDGGGFLQVLRPVAGFAMPRGVACPIWPVFTALGQVGRPVCADVSLPGGPETRLRCFALARQIAAPDDLTPPVLQSTMIVLPDPDPDSSPPLPIGMACRICPRSPCVARREPSALV